MGLGFNKSEAHWAYSGFNRFRERLANEIGICLPLMEGFWNPSKESMSSVELSKRILGTETFDKLYWLPKEPLKWEKIKDPIVDLLYHSDCEGSLSAKQCGKIAPRLIELIADWNDDDYDKQQALLLAEGMEACYKKRVKLIFC